MKEFFKSLLSSKDETISSKRVVGFGSFIVFCIIVFTHLYKGKDIQEAIIWSTVALIAACFSLNTMINIKALSSKSQVASDIVKEDASPENSETAKEVIQAEQPK